MSSIVDLGELIRSASPELLPEEYVFLTVPSDHAASSLAPLCTFRETEGLSVIVTKKNADAGGHPRSPTFRQITMRVNSSLEAVGFLAAIAAALARAGIPCNAVSAFHHDHIFVPSESAPQALVILRALSHSTP